MNNKPTPKAPKTPKFNFYWIYGIIALFLLSFQFIGSSGAKNEISENKFFDEIAQSGDVKQLIIVRNQDLAEVYLTAEALESEEYQNISKNMFGMKNTGPHYEFTILSFENFQQKLDQLPNVRELNIKTTKRENWGFDLLSLFFPIIIIVIIWMFIMRRMNGGGGIGGGDQIFSIGKSKASLFDKDSTVNVTFKDVAGLAEAKEEVAEIVDFLKSPKKYTSLGGKIPKGALLVGPPGTGKTLLAKAMAGEAQVPFFSISGSDFVEMFVGVGASRVRDLFKQAREKAPCIIFIDEIDAIGRARGKSMMQGGNDERENTLNQLLVEMDGFASEKGVIIIAATNRPDVLDKALLRPGRFDRQIGIDAPGIKGREEIFKVHLKPIKTSDDIKPAHLAAQAPGFAGAEIANVCNEAALIAARKNKKQVEMEDFEEAVDRSIGGLERKSRLIAPAEKKIIAYHEAGHAIAGWFLDHADPLVKVTIIPRGIAALGYAQYLPKEDFLRTTEQLIDSICMTLGGRAAEELIFGKISTGAQNDLERITKLAYGMVTVYGMDPKVGNVSFNNFSDEYAFGKPYSEDTAKMIDDEVRKLIDEAYQRTLKLLEDKREELEIIAQRLLEKEVLFRHDLEELIGKRPQDVAKEQAALNETTTTPSEESSSENITLTEDNTEA